MNFPKGLMKDTSIPLLSRCLHAIIVSLHNTKDGCYAGNEWFADELGVCDNTISKHMGLLDGEKFIEREIRPRKYGGRDRFIIPLKYINIPKRKSEYTQKGITNDTHRNSELDNKDIPNSNSSNRKNNNSSSDITPSPDLLLELEAYCKENNKDMKKALKSFFLKSQNLTEDNIEERLRNWIHNEHPIQKKVEDLFRLDGSGNAYVGYCNRCGVSDFYKKEDLYGDSNCCRSKLRHDKPKRNSQVGNSEWQ